MKRFICIILSVLSAVSLYGCKNKAEEPLDPVNFYYLTSADDYEKTHQLLSAEVRDRAAYNDNLLLLLNSYLKGPDSDHLKNPFPDKCAVESITQDGAQINLFLNHPFAKLTGIDLMVACCCIGHTIFQITDYEAVSFCVPNQPLDGNKAIVLHRQDILFHYIGE